MRKSSTPGKRMLEHKTEVIITVLKIIFEGSKKKTEMLQCAHIVCECTRVHTLRAGMRDGKPRWSKYLMISQEMKQNKINRKLWQSIIYFLEILK